MEIQKQLIILLLVIMVVHLLFLMLSVRFANRKKKSEVGPLIGTELLGLSYYNENNSVDFIDQSMINEKKAVLIVDKNCSACSDLIHKIGFLKNEQKEKVLFAQMFFEDIGKSKIESLGQCIYFDENVVIDTLNVNGFPFIIGFDDDGIVRKKNYASMDLFLEYLSEDKERRVV